MPLTHFSTRYLGPLPAKLWDILEMAWKEGVALQGNFARENANVMALAASNGWISTITPNSLTYTTRWRITAAGLTALQHKELMS